jgi:aspartate/methionine/tyrosine aminotransferase
VFNNAAAECDSNYHGRPSLLPVCSQRCKEYKRRAEIACEHFSKIPELIVNMPHGAFYMSVIFKDGVLTDKQRLPIENKE